MSEQPSLKRDGTMQVTAQEGKEFLDSKGMTVTDDDVKTRGQKEALDKITSASDSQEKEKKDGKEKDDDTKQENSEPAKPKIPRDGTMVVTAKEGQELLDGAELERTRGQTATAASQKSPISKVKRTTTMAQTTQDGSLILGQGERGRTRSQTRKMSEGGEEEKKTPVKRAGTMEQTVKAGEEFLASEAKRAKVDNNTEKIPEVDETSSAAAPNEAEA